MLITKLNIKGWFCKMLRNTRHSYKPNLCWQNSIEKTYGEIKSKRKDGTRDFYPPIPAAQTCSRFS